MSDAELRAGDLTTLGERGITAAEAERQLRLLRGPAPYLVLDRPCRVGDGIEQIDDADRARLTALHEEAAGAARLTVFVPASGAATRMFKDLLAYRGVADLDDTRLATDPAAGGLRTFLAGLGRFAFRDDLSRVLGADVAGARPAAVLEALLSETGLGYAQLPKGLLAFHAYPDGARTPFEEHLVEAAALTLDFQGRCRLHFTVSPEHRDRFADLATRAAAAYGARLGVEYSITFSEQSPATDTLATDGEGRPFRDADGGLVMRPAGHGALLANLQALGADVVLIKNIDNVAAERAKAATLVWSRLLIGRLIEVEQAVFALLRRLEADADADAVADARRFALDVLRRDASDADRAGLRDLLARPLRVCGMVPNTGEPGGGPFWVRDAGGAVSRQIVESAQVDVGAPAQKAHLTSATHFNPVFLAVGLRDHKGRPHDLERFVDPAAVIVTRKSHGGRDLVALERPGLWNGAMGGWNSLFLEVPGAVFNPVKTVNDLLRPEHQP